MSLLLIFVYRRVLAGTVLLEIEERRDERMMKNVTGRRKTREESSKEEERERDERMSLEGGEAGQKWRRVCAVAGVHRRRQQISEGVQQLLLFAAVFWFVDLVDSCWILSVVSKTRDCFRWFVVRWLPLSL